MIEIHMNFYINEEKKRMTDIQLQNNKMILTAIMVIGNLQKVDCPKERLVLMHNVKHWLFGGDSENQLLFVQDDCTFMGSADTLTHCRVNASPLVTFRT